MSSHSDDDRDMTPRPGGHNVTAATLRLLFDAKATSVWGALLHQDVATIRKVVAQVRQVVVGNQMIVQPMTPDRVKNVREGLGLSQEGLAAVLRLGSYGKRTVARWEAGDNPVPGPVSVALEALEAGWRPGDGRWHDVREVFLTVLDAIEGAVREARDNVRNAGEPK